MKEMIKMWWMSLQITGSSSYRLVAKLESFGHVS